MDLEELEMAANGRQLVQLISIRNNEVFLDREIDSFTDFSNFIDYLHRSSESSRIADS